jgi:hypothetical protein
MACGMACGFHEVTMPRQPLLVVASNNGRDTVARVAEAFAEA